jgi:hypothetical protein
LIGGVASIRPRHLIRGTRLGIPVGLAVGLSSYHYTGSVIRAALTALVVTAIGAVCQGFIEQRTERRLRAKGITLTDVPVRPMLRLEFDESPERAIEFCRDALRASQLRVKQTEVDEPCKLVITTRISFHSFGERITLEARPGLKEGCVLQMSSTPLLTTTKIDSGVNYTNLFLLSKYIRASLGADVSVREELIDLESRSSLQR